MVGWFAKGLGTGMAMMLLVHLVQQAGGWVTVGPGERSVGRREGVNLLLLVLVSALEEWIFRGFLFDLLLPRAGVRATLVITSALFGLLHLGNGVGVLTVINAGLAGAAFGAARLYAGGLALPVGLHVGWNLMQWPLLGYPLYGVEREGFLRFPTLLTSRPQGPWWFSGGRDGPEGSLLDTAVFAFLLFLLLRGTAGLP